jgi:hypothetical protein
MTDVVTKHYTKYAMLYKNGASHDQIVQVMAEDMNNEERDELKRAEMRDVDAYDRAKITDLVRYAAKELRIPPPRIRFLASKGLPFGGCVYADTPDEIWIAGDRPLHEMRNLALHETKHVEHLADGTPHEIREHDAERFAATHRLWR